MRIGIVGCGYVADFYAATLPLHPELEVVAVTDLDPGRGRTWASAHGGQVYETADELIADERVDIVVNLTDPRAHYEISKAALSAGKHVYSEKPLAMSFEHAGELVELAAANDLVISCAPCSALGESAQTMGKALRDGVVGDPLVVYAEMDDGLVSAAPYRDWPSSSGLPWPYKDEFEVGCTIEHAAYVLGWLCAFFGPAEKVVAFGSVQVPDKVPGEELDMVSPDFTVGCIQWPSGLVARLTTGIVAPHDHQLTIVGTDGLLFTDETWDYQSPVRSRRRLSIRKRTMLAPVAKRHKLVDLGFGETPKHGLQRMDFARGIAELAASVNEQRPSRLNADFSLHVNEIVLAIHNSLEGPNVVPLQSSFDPVEPMPVID